ncbi:DUF397 domain-containing protein [Streptomyces paromomycinus]|uniref:DUF397 domain-containing protein n=1 Tax=Streptomyces paromomycinus TaxID=92743 RepID=A0A401WAR7_STREY|nr:DUF397 domain-containing protein [Streptomyces paromomycinus]GCD46403.1 hypothetical protein GKJPGBOP_06152 [Streptomyces paromomycinus]
MRSTPDLSTTRWRKSSYSNTNGGECVEIAEDLPGIIPVRDSKTPHGPILTFPTASWTTFITALKTAER